MNRKIEGIKNSQKNPFVNDRGETLLQLLNGEKRFTDLKKIYKSPATLSSRLRELESLNLIDRRLGKGRRSIIYYCITEKGKKVASIYKKFMEEISSVF